MENLFCNECHLTEQIPKLISEELLGIENLPLLKERYLQMREGYDFSYKQWQELFTEDLKPFRGYTDTTAVTMQIRHQLFKQDFERIGKGSIGLDLPTWFNIEEYKPRVMLIFQDPLRSKSYQDCRDAVLSSPFGLHDATHRNRANGGKMANELVKRLTDSGLGVYLTDSHKYFISDHKTSDAYSLVFEETYTKILEKEISIVKPAILVLFGNHAGHILHNVVLENPNLIYNYLVLPHLSGTARRAIIGRFPSLKDLGADAQNVAEQYANEILAQIEYLK